LCSFNATTSYFTASSNKSGALNFPLLDVRFTTITNSTTPDNQMQASPSKITLFPYGGNISRGQTFELSLSDAADATKIDNIEIKNMEGSCEVYVRFWIDAYTYSNGVQGTTNYGEYFLIEETSDIVRGTGSEDIEETATEGSWCYFVVPSILSGGAQIIGNKITISADLPDDVLGQQLKITMTLEAVQALNGAFVEEFGDAEDKKGYYSEWYI
jgi:hypothetical protein